MPKTPADKRLTIRFTDAEYRALETCAGTTPVSRFVRETLLQSKASKRRKAVAQVDKAGLAQAIGLLGKSDLHRSLSKLAQAAELGALPLDDQTQARLEEAFLNIKDMRKALLEALGARED